MNQTWEWMQVYFAFTHSQKDNWSGKNFFKDHSWKVIKFIEDSSILGSPSLKFYNVTYL